MTGKLLHARMFMGRQLLIHWLSRLDPTVRRRRGMRRFTESFYPEHLHPPTPAARDLLPIAERCQACDLCLLVPGEEGRLSPRDLVLRVTRGGNDWHVARPLLASDQTYARAEPLCPDRIPFRRVAAMLRAEPPGAR